jgi:hypothetical protein
MSSLPVTVIAAKLPITNLTELISTLEATRSLAMATSSANPMDAATGQIGSNAAIQGNAFQILSLLKNIQIGAGNIVNANWTLPQTVSMGFLGLGGGKIQVSKAMQRDFRYRIRKKIKILQNQELPLLVNNGFFEFNKQDQLNQYISTISAQSVVTNDDGVVSNHDGSRWSSLVKIPPQTWPEIDGNPTQLTQSNTKINGKTAKWAGSDLNPQFEFFYLGSYYL